jgi:hypothetical protein
LAEVYDATTNSTFSATATATTAPPTVSAQNILVAANQSVSLSSYFSVSHPSNDNLYYYVFDIGNDGGYLTVGGTREPDGQAFLTASNWSNAQYVGAPSGGSEDVLAEVYDATTNSTSSATATATTATPTISAQNILVAANQPVSLSSVFSVSNPSDDSLYYYVFDVGNDGGYLTVGGTREPDGQAFLTASNWSNAQYVGAPSAGSESLLAEVYDATTNSTFSATCTATTTVAMLTQSMAAGFGGGSPILNNTSPPSTQLESVLALSSPGR